MANSYAPLRFIQDNGDVVTVGDPPVCQHLHRPARRIEYARKACPRLR